MRRIPGRCFSGLSATVFLVLTVLASAPTPVAGQERDYLVGEEEEALEIEDVFVDDEDYVTEEDDAPEVSEPELDEVGEEKESE